MWIHFKLFSYVISKLYNTLWYSLWKHGNMTTRTIHDSFPFSWGLSWSLPQKKEGIKKTCSKCMWNTDVFVWKLSRWDPCYVCAICSLRQKTAQSHCWFSSCVKAHGLWGMFAEIRSDAEGPVWVRCSLMQYIVCHL